MIYIINNKIVYDINRYYFIITLHYLFLKCIMLYNIMNMKNRIKSILVMN